MDNKKQASQNKTVIQQANKAQHQNPTGRALQYDGPCHRYGWDAEPSRFQRNIKVKVYVSEYNSHAGKLPL